MLPAVGFIYRSLIWFLTFYLHRGCATSCRVFNKVMDEKYTYPREYLLNNLVILFGGRVAEELVIEQTTTGAGNDIEKATDLARRMVCEWGMPSLLNLRRAEIAGFENSQHSK